MEADGGNAFRFAVKGSRFLTHMKKLKDPAPGLEKFLARAELLGSKLGPVLFQFPPHWPLNLERLAGFLEALPPQHRYCFEFREPAGMSRKSTGCWNVTARHSAHFTWPAF